jgi:hypothetical protein
LPNSALVPTESLQKVQVESEVESLAEIKEEPIKEVVVNPAEIEVVEQAITVTGVNQQLALHYKYKTRIGRSNCGWQKIDEPHKSNNLGCNH